MKHIIDAKDKKIGRIASLAAQLLMGKNTTKFAKNIVPDVEVVITNASQVDFNAKKVAGKEYAVYSGFPGGLKNEKAKDIIEKKGYKEIIVRAVYGMLPTNKLRAKRMKKLTISE